MNELAMRDNPLETAAEELKDEVYLKTNAVRTIDNMSRQLDFLARLASGSRQYNSHRSRLQRPCRRFTTFAAWRAAYQRNAHGKAYA